MSELKSSPMSTFVNEALLLTVERSSTARHHTGAMFHHLIRTHVITMSDYVTGHHIVRINYFLKQLRRTGVPKTSGIISTKGSSFSALTLLVGSFDPLKTVPDMTYNVFGGTLNLALSIYTGVIRPILKYVATVWNHLLTLTQIDQLEAMLTTFAFFIISISTYVDTDMSDRIVGKTLAPSVSGSLYPLC